MNKLMFCSLVTCIASVPSLCISAEEVCHYGDQKYSVGTSFDMPSKEKKLATFRCGKEKETDVNPIWILVNYVDKNGKPTESKNEAAEYTDKMPPK